MANSLEVETFRFDGSILKTDKPMDRYGFTGGIQYTSEEMISKVPLTVIRQRETKWIEMINHWDKWSAKRFKKIKERCHKGIPPSIRALAWQHLCGGKQDMDRSEGKFNEYSKLAGSEQCVEEIRRDVDRQFPYHEIFMTKSGQGQEDLFEVLKVYSIINPEDGYCQAQAPIAAVLLTQMPVQPAYFCFAAICDRYLPSYFSTGLDIIQIDGEILYGLLKHFHPEIHQHLRKQKIEPILVMTEWFMCIFARTLPWPTVLRVWDLFLCEGFKILFLTALVLIRSCLGPPNQLSSFKSMYDTLERLRHIPQHYMQEDYLISEMLKLNISDRLIEVEHKKQLSLWKSMNSKDIFIKYKRVRLKDFKEEKDSKHK